MPDKPDEVAVLAPTAFRSATVRFKALAIAAMSNPESANAVTSSAVTVLPAPPKP